jgi:hypothetical protein
VPLPFFALAIFLAGRVFFALVFLAVILLSNSPLIGRYRIASVLVRPAPLDFDGGTASRSGRAETRESLKNP